MIRLFSCFALFCCTFCLVGCGSGGEAKFDPSTVEAQSQEEIDADADYAKQMAEQSENYDGKSD